MIVLLCAVASLVALALRCLYRSLDPLSHAWVGILLILVTFANTRSNVVAALAVLAVYASAWVLQPRWFGCCRTAQSADTLLKELGIACSDKREGP